MGDRRRSSRTERRIPARRCAQARLTLSARLLIEYDGAGFAGWARQPGRRTVQDCLEAAHSRILGREVALAVAGRTDAGVHARGQVASHDGDAVPAYALNGVLPPDIRVIDSQVAADGFDARRDATSRGYRYRVFTRKIASPFESAWSLHWPHSVDRALLEQCGRSINGTRDFRAFTPTGTHHMRFERRILHACWHVRDEHRLELTIEADSFMRHMVRTLVGTMLAVAGGRMSLEHFEALLTGRARGEAADTAAPHGLYLEFVRYGEQSPAAPFATIFEMGRSELPLLDIAREPRSC